jgi:hypothetical protein
LPALDHGSRLAVVNHGWREKFDAGVAVLLVIPSEEFLTEGAAVLDRAKSINSTAYTHCAGPQNCPRVCDMKVEAAAFLFFLHPLPERM